MFSDRPGTPGFRAQIDELIKYVDLQMADSTMSWHMQPDGTYVLHTKDDEGRPLVDSQEYLIRKHQMCIRDSMGTPQVVDGADRRGHPELDMLGIRLSLIHICVRLAVSS